MLYTSTFGSLTGHRVSSASRSRFIRKHDIANKYRDSGSFLPRLHTGIINQKSLKISAAKTEKKNIVVKFGHIKGTENMFNWMDELHACVLIFKHIHDCEQSRGEQTFLPFNMWYAA
jgi:hypothetical protein